MTNKGAAKILCTILYNGIKEKLDNIKNGLNIYNIIISDFNIFNDDEGFIIYFGDPSGDEKVEAKVIFKKNGSITIDIDNNEDDEEFIFTDSAIVLFCLMETLSQGIKYSIDWKKGLDEFGEYSPALVINWLDNDIYNYYTKLINIMINGIKESYVQNM